MDGRQSTKISIPHPHDLECDNIVGILERTPTEPTTNRKIALILHGTMGHKDYLFQKRLARRLPMDSFRFDFRGNHETGGTWKQGALEDDVLDLTVVVEYLQREYQYTIDLIVGHSRGSVVAFHYLCTSPAGKTVTGFVNASGRYRMKKILDSPGAARWKTEFATKGYAEWNVVVARKPINARIYPDDVESFTNWDTSIVWDKFPPHIDVLTIHGLSDQTVPPYDAMIYARALSNRNPGTHSLHMMEDADHNFTGRQDEVVDVITDWWDLHRIAELRTGVWLSGVKGKL